MTRSVTVLLLAVTGAVGQIATMGPWDRSISGKLTNGQTGAPIAKRTVSARPRDGSGREVTAETDAEGRYKISHLLPGSYVVTVKGGDESVFSTANATLTEDRDATGVNLTLDPSSELSGIVMDREKRPYLSVPVTLLEKVYRNNRIAYQSVAGAATDAQGRYRFSRVLSGRTYVLLAQVTPRAFLAISDEPEDMEQRLPSLMPAYFMNSNFADGALPISPSPGQKLEGLDIQMDRVKSYCAEGVLEAEGKPASASFDIDDLHYVVERPTSGMFVFRSGKTVRSGPDGKFRICGLHPGEYRLNTSLDTARGQTRFAAALPFTITDRDLANLKLSVAPVVSVRGEVVWDGDMPTESEPAQVRVSILAVHPKTAGTTLLAPLPGRFASEGVQTDEYSIHAEAPAGYYIKDVSYGGASILNQVFQLGAGDGVQIVVARDGGTISAKVADEDANPVRAANVWFLPSSATTAAELEAVLDSCLTDTTGGCISPALRPGKYRVLATIEKLTHSAADIDKLWGARLKGSEVELSAKASAQVSLTPTAVF